MTDVLLVLGIVALIGLATALLRRREGAARAVDGPSVDLGALGVPAGTVAFVEFTAPGCAPCARTRQVLEHVAEQRSDVTVVAVDVAEHLDLAREHGVLRTPTTLLVDPAGAVRHRITGVPASSTLAALLDGDHQAAA